MVTARRAVWLCICQMDRMWRICRMDSRHSWKFPYKVGELALGAHEKAHSPGVQLIISMEAELPFGRGAHDHGTPFVRNLRLESDDRFACSSFRIILVTAGVFWRLRNLCSDFSG